MVSAREHRPRDRGADEAEREGEVAAEPIRAEDDRLETRPKITLSVCVVGDSGIKWAAVES